MKFRKYHIVIVDDGNDDMARVYSVNWLGIRKFLGQVPTFAIHTLFY